MKLLKEIILKVILRVLIHNYISVRYISFLKKINLIANVVSQVYMIRILYFINLQRIFEPSTLVSQHSLLIDI